MDANMAQRNKSETEDKLTIRPLRTTHRLNIPFHNAAIQAGFPSPADDYLSSPIDLNTELISHPASTFMGRVSGDSMKDAGIFNGDLLIIDKSLRAKTGDVAVCFIDGEFTIKYIKIQKNSILLIPANPEFPEIRVTADNDFMIWGIVTYSIRRHRTKR